MMNFKAILPAVFILALKTSCGQGYKYDAGIELGPNVVSLRGNEALNNYHEPAIAFAGGLFFQYNTPKIFAIRTGIFFERKGSVANVPITDNNGIIVSTAKTHTNFDYLTLPVLLRIILGSKNTLISLNAGPYFGYLIKQTFVLEGDNIQTITTDNTFRDKRFDAGISAGLGLLFPIKEKYVFSFEVRDNLGLYNVSAVPVLDNGSIKTNSVNFLFGFSHRLGLDKPQTK